MVLKRRLFYTVDFAEKENGEWTIIETGDGGVSGLSEGQDYEAFYRAVYVLGKEYTKLNTLEITKDKSHEER